MKTKVEMTDLGLMNYFLGIKVTQYGICIFLSRYSKDVLKRFRVENFNLLVNPNATSTKISKKYQY